jgi:uncharacterized protein (TIGR00296 family)
VSNLRNRADRCGATTLRNARRISDAMRYTDQEGVLAVQIAREALEAFVEDRAMRSFVVPKTFEEKAGAFVTLTKHGVEDPYERLRGCIGYPEPFFALLKSVVKSAEGAAEDPRFPPLRPEELTKVIVEVSLLTTPQPIEVKKQRDLPKQIRLGEDGIVVAQGAYRGLFLPQVATEHHMDAETFLAECCMKAGLMPDAWLEDSTRVKKFQSEIFEEVEPRGAIVRRKLA